MSIPLFAVGIVQCDEDGFQKRLGSGFHIAPDWVLTARHVVDACAPEAALWVTQGENAEFWVVRHGIRKCATRDLALLPINTGTEQLAIAPVITGIGPQQREELRTLELDAFGYPEALSKLAQFSNLEVSLADSEWRDISLGAGLPEGFSGGPLCFGRDNDWNVVGLLILGGKSAATTRAVGMPELIRFLDENGLVPHRTISARDALKRHHGRPVWDYEHEKCRQLRGIDSIRSIDTGKCYRAPPLELLPVRAGASPSRKGAPVEPVETPPDLCIDDFFRGIKAIRDLVPSQIPRLLVLADPGGGKTALLDQIACQCREPIGKDFTPLPWSTSLIPARFRLSEWQAHGADLPGFLEAHYHQRCMMPALPPPTADRWRQRLLDGSVLLLMDGLDKIAPDENLDLRGRFADLLKSFPQCPVVVTCRTLDYQKVENWFRPDQFSLLMLGGLSLQQQLDYIDDFPEPFNKARLKITIEKSRELVSLFSNPLLLMIACSVAAEAGVPSTRAELFDAAIDKLLMPVGDPWGAANGGPYGLEDVRHWLEALALELIARGDGGDGHSQATVQSALQRNLNAQVAGDAPAVNHILTTYVKHGLISQDPGSRKDACRFRFRHSALQEFLAASALAREVNEQGLQHSMELAGLCKPVSDWLERLSWDPKGQELLVFTVAQLKDPLAILQCLADERLDDYLRHRLALAARILAELPKSQRRRPQLMDFTRRVRREVVTLVRRYSRYAREPAFAHLVGALRALCARDLEEMLVLLGNWGTGGASMDEKRAFLLAMSETGLAVTDRQRLDQLLNLLQDPQQEIRRLAAVAIGEQGRSGASGYLLGPLRTMLEDPNAREHAVAAIDAMGKPAQTPETLLALCEVLRDQLIEKGENPEPPPLTGAHSEILVWLFKLGEQRPKPLRTWILLTKMLGHWEGSAPPALLQHFVETGQWRRARSLVEFLNGPLVTLGIQARLADALQDARREDLREILNLLSHLGGASVTSAILVALVHKIKTGDVADRRLATWGIGKLGPLSGFVCGVAAEAETICEELSILIHHSDPEVRDAAVWSIGRLGRKALTDRLLQDCTDAILSSNPVSKIAAARALTRFGDRAASSEILAVLPAMMAHEEAEIRLAAADLVGHLGTAVTDETILDSLCHLMQDSDGFVRVAVFETLVRSGRQLARPPIIEGLADALTDLSQADDMRVVSLRALRVFDEQANTPRMRQTLADLAHDHREENLPLLRELFTDLGAWAATDEVLDALACALSNPRGDVRAAAARAVAGLGPSAATPGILAGLIGLLKADDKQLRWAAVKTVDRLGADALTPALVVALLRHLDGRNDTLAAVLADRYLGLRGGSWARDEHSCQRYF